jgi:hypothetical protein
LQLHLRAFPYPGSPGHLDIIHGARSSQTPATPIVIAGNPEIRSCQAGILDNKAARFLTKEGAAA